MEELYGPEAASPSHAHAEQYIAHKDKATASRTLLPFFPDPYRNEITFGVCTLTQPFLIFSPNIIESVLTRIDRGILKLGLYP